MATNYTFAQACAIINEGTNTEAIADIGRRYPVLLHKVSQVTAVAGDKFVDLMSFMPDYLTANKVNSALKSAGSAGSNDSDDDTEATGSDDVEATSDSAGGMPDFESMSGKQLWDILGKAGKRKTAKSTKKSDLVAACKAMYENGAEAEAESDDEEKSSDDAEAAGPYDGKSAMELFKECKKRGIKAAPKKPTKYYIDLLSKADAESGDDEAGSDDWDDDAGNEAEEPKKAKDTSKKDSGKAEGKKKSAKKEASEDGDDDWDI